MKRAPTENLANLIDQRLFNLLARVDDAIVESRGADNAKWREAAFALRTARGHIRSLMSDDDRKSTI